ncbi:MAG: hypothetical protein ACFB6S_19630 [Geminicoccaceae bacterium]
MSEALEKPVRNEARDLGRPFRFALLCHQRSGSNALSGLLRNEPEIKLYGQLFNHFLHYRYRNFRLGVGRYTAPQDAMRHFGLRPPPATRLTRAIVSLTPKHATLDDFMDAFWQKFHAERMTGALGFKLHDFQISDDDLASLSRDHVDGVVMLWRRNRLKAAVSWAYAIKTDVWSLRNDAKNERPVHELDPNEIQWFIEKTTFQVNNWRRILCETGANWIELTYEDDIVTRNLERLYRFLGVAYQGPPAFKTQRLSTSRYQHVANAEDIERQLASSETGSLFD